MNWNFYNKTPHKKNQKKRNQKFSKSKKRNQKLFKNQKKEIKNSKKTPKPQNPKTPKIRNKIKKNFWIIYDYIFKSISSQCF